MKILLCNPPWIKNGIFGVRAGSRWPHFQKDDYLPFPFFLSYAAGVLEKEGHDIWLIDAIASRLTKKELIQKIKDTRPELILFEISTPSLYNDLDIAKTVKGDLGENIRIAMSGLHYGLCLPSFLQEYKFIDFSLYGEYEYTIRDLAKALENNSNLDMVKGLVYRNSEGEIRKTPPEPLIDNLDLLPWPSRHLLPIFKYSDTPCGIPKPSLQMWASRGCPYKCIFCAWPQIMYGGNSYRVRNPVNVIDEMEWCIKKYGFKSVYFDDDTFNIGNERMLRICEEIRKRNLNIPWAIMARADTSTKEALREMKRAGLYSLKFGVESGTQEILNNSGKNLNLEKVKESVSWCKELDIKVHLTFMFGLPGETKETIKKTIDFALGLRPFSLQFSIATPFPGSSYYRMLKEHNELATTDWNRYDGAEHAVIKTNKLTEKDLEQSLKDAYKTWGRYCFRKKYMTKRYFMKGIFHPLRAIKMIIPRHSFGMTPL